MDNPGGELQKSLARIGIEALLDMVSLWRTALLLIYPLIPTHHLSPSAPLHKCIYILQLFIHNFVHGDLHPGNILVQETLEPRIVLLDCGIATSLTPYDLQQMRKLFTAIIKGEVSITCTVECRGFESHLRQLIFLRKSDCLR